MVDIFGSEQRQPHSSMRLEFDEDAEHFGNEIPVRVSVKETELLMSQDKDGMMQAGVPLFIPAFATLGMACLRVCKRVGRAALDLDDYANELLFQMKEGDVLVCSTMNGVR